VRDHQAGRASGAGKDPLPERALCLYVERAGEVVKDQQFRLAHKHTRRGGALKLSARDHDALGADHRVQAVFHIGQVLLHHRKLDGPAIGA